MDLDNLTYPNGYAKPSKPQVEVFYTWVWQNSELCKECFTQVRSIGDEITVKGAIHTHKINTYYERTENGIQAHTAFEKASDRFGQTFCKKCGSDTQNLNYIWSLEELKTRAVNLISYFNTSDEPPYTIDGEVMGKTLTDLKKVPDNQGYDTEILAVGTINGIFA